MGIHCSHLCGGVAEIEDYEILVCEDLKKRYVNNLEERSVCASSLSSQQEVGEQVTNCFPKKIDATGADSIADSNRKDEMNDEVTNSGTDKSDTNSGTDKSDDSVRSSSLLAEIEINEHMKKMLFEKACESAGQGRLFEALAAHQKSKELGCRSRDGIDSVDDEAYKALDSLEEKVGRVRRQRKACAPRDGDGWKKFSLGTVTMWRQWEPKSNNLNVVLKYEAAGSLQQFIAAIRDADVAEPSWDGQCWDMETQQSCSSTLARWLQKDPLSGKHTEVLLDRVLCDCMEDEVPCWVLVERSPDIPDFETFSGQWSGFDIKSVPAGYIRTVMAESGRVMEYVDENCTRCTASLSFQLPNYVRWLVTDRFLTIAVRTFSAKTAQSWQKIVDDWPKGGYPNRIRENALFYGPVQERIDKCVGLQSATKT